MVKVVKKKNVTHAQFMKIDIYETKKVLSNAVLNTT